MATLEQRLTNLASAIGSDVKALFARVIPTGGAAGQVLGKTGTGPTDFGWVTLAAGGGGSTTVHSVTLDFGAAGVRGKTFTFAQPLATAGAKVLMTVAGPADGRAQDELEMDGLEAAAVCLTNGEITATVRANPGPVSGQYTFNYILG